MVGLLPSTSLQAGVGCLGKRHFLYGAYLTQDATSFLQCDCVEEVVFPAPSPLYASK